MSASRGGPRAPTLIGACEGCGQDFTYQVRSCRRKKRCDPCQKLKHASYYKDWAQRTGWTRPSRAKGVQA